MTLSCVTFWIGDRLGDVERACLKSVLRQGHSLSLYCYREPEGVPEGIEIRDAATIIPEEHVIRHSSGSVSLFADWFRYELQRRGCGTWVDTDIYLVAPLPEETLYLFGSQGDLINQAVLRLPADCPVIGEAIALFAEKEVPSWLPLLDRLAARWRLLATGRTGIAGMPWGTAGPRALTALLQRHGLDAHALPQRIFYPVPWREADWIRDPAIPLETKIAPDTIAIHLWNQCIESFKDAPAPGGSFLARLQGEGRV